MNSKVVLVALREFTENLRTKAFWLGILMFPLLITVAMIVPSLLERAKGIRQFAVVDEQEGKCYDSLERKSLVFSPDSWLPEMERGIRRGYSWLEQPMKLDFG